MNSKFYPHKNFGDIVQQTILPIFAIADGEIIPLGTGFVVMSSGLIMTAKHVVDDFTKEKVKRRDGNGYYDQVSINVLYVSDERHGTNNEFYTGGPWRILKVSFSKELDIAFCWLEGMLKDEKPFEFKAVTKLSPALPSVGSKICGFGYYKSSAIFSSDIILGNKVVDFSQKTAITEGHVVEIKDAEGFRKFPHFRSDARFEPGMSGGPVFKEDGSVCGVICSSLSGCSEDEGYISYVSLIWPSFGITTETSFSEGGLVEEVLIYDLAKRGFIATDKTFDNLFVEINSEGLKNISLKIK